MVAEAGLAVRAIAADLSAAGLVLADLVLVGLDEAEADDFAAGAEVFAAGVDDFAAGAEADLLVAVVAAARFGVVVVSGATADLDVTAVADLASEAGRFGFL